jgi:hypothetical protein
MNESRKPDRRAAVRWDSTQQAECHFATLERFAARWATVLNVSRVGVGLVLPCSFEAGRELIVKLPCKDLAGEKAVIAYVVHAKAHSPGNWAVGCTFAQPLTQDELDLLL